MSAEMMTIKEKWDFFERACLKGVSEQQRQEAHVAFYAGASSLLAMQMKLYRPEVSIDDGVKFIQTWEEECTEFGKNIIMEQARRRGEKPN